MDRIDQLLADVRVLPNSRLNVAYRDGRIDVELADGRDQTIWILREGDHYVLTSVVLGSGRLAQQQKSVLQFAERLWCRNRQTDVVNFTFDAQNRLVGRIEHPAATLDADELFFYLSRLANECDRMEYLLTGENRF